MKDKIESMRETLVYMKENSNEENYVKFAGCFAKLERELSELEGSL